MDNQKPKKKTTPNKQFFLTVPVKPYVKRFLELNYGDPVYFHPDRSDYNRLRQSLRDSRLAIEKDRFSYIVDDKTCTYKCSVTILLSERDFYRYGWELTKAEILKLNSVYEAKAKALMRSVVGVYHALGLPMYVSIQKFQDKFYFDENVWPYQSIKKDFYRNGTISRIDFESEIFNKIEKIVVTNLYTAGTVTSTYIFDYENDQQA